MDSTKHCYMCEKEFKIGNEFKDHWRSHGSDTKVSNSLKDSCKIQCNICEKSFNFSSFRLHITREHEISQRNYKKRYNLKSFVLSEKFLHRCALCNIFLLLDSERLRNHIQVKHKDDNVTWQKYQFLHMNQGKEKRQKDLQFTEKQRTKPVISDISHALTRQANKSKASDNDIESFHPKRNEASNDYRTDGCNTAFDTKGIKKPSDAMVPVKVELDELLEEMEDPLNIDSEVGTELTNRQRTEVGLTTSCKDVTMTNVGDVPRPDGVSCPKCPRKFTLVGQLVHMRDNLRCHIGLVHFSQQLATEARKVFEGTQCQMCDFSSEKNDKRKRHLIYKHSIYVTEILEITETTIKSFIESNTNSSLLRKTTEMGENVDIWDKNNKNIQKSLSDSFPEEIRTMKTVELSPEKNQAASNTPVCTNKDVGNSEKVIQRREPVGGKEISSMLVENPQLIASFRKFVARVKKPGETAAMEENGGFSAIEMILQLDSGKIRKLAK